MASHKLFDITLNRGVRIVAPALPNSNALISWGRTLCLFDVNI
jgi:hypothetical protein